MKQTVLAMVFLFLFTSAYAQEEKRKPLRGKVLYRSVNVPGENVINTTSEEATITDENGDFIINVRVGDELVFTAVNYQFMILKVTKEHIKKNRLVVEVKEKVTELEEVVITPENQEEFVKSISEKFEKHYYEVDRSTKVENVAQSNIQRGMQNGINFVNIFKALMGSKKDKNTTPALKVSQVLRKVYDDDFFVKDLGIPQKRIDAFLFYCDDKLPTQSLLKKANEFQLIDFLVTQSKTFLKQ